MHRLLMILCVAIALGLAVENDDYCDTGNDEMGSSACSGRSKKKFICTGSEYVKQEIFLSRVHDGVCDCCSGADEVGGLVECPNTCAELEKSEKERIAREKQVRLVGLEKKVIAVASGKAALQEMRNSISTNAQMGAKFDSKIAALEEELKDEETMTKLTLDAKVKEAEMIYLNAVRSSFQEVPVTILQKMISSIVYRGKEEVAEVVLKAAEGLYEGPGESADDTQVLMLSMETPEDTDVTVGLFVVNPEGQMVRPVEHPRTLI